MYILKYFSALIQLIENVEDRRRNRLKSFDTRISTCLQLHRLKIRIRTYKKLDELLNTYSNCYGCLSSFEKNDRFVILYSWKIVLLMSTVILHIYKAGSDVDSEILLEQATFPMRKLLIKMSMNNQNLLLVFGGNAKSIRSCAESHF